MSSNTPPNPSKDSPDSKKRIVITGGSGVVGRCVIEKLLQYGHNILNVDQTPLDNPKVHTLKADLTDGAQAFNALSCHFQISEPFRERLRTPDVVVHLAGTCRCRSSYSNPNRVRNCEKEKGTRDTAENSVFDHVLFVHVFCRQRIYNGLQHRDHAHA
jgi:NAD(P)-dependent dehydrogenase (short-subunit alcohol dehydrogenase family)